MFDFQDFLKALPNIGIDSNGMRRTNVAFCSIYLYTKEHPHDRVESCSFVITYINNELTISRGSVTYTIDTIGKETVDVIKELLLIKFFNKVAESMGRENVSVKTSPLITHVDGMIFYETRLIENMPYHYIMRDVMTGLFHVYHRDHIDFKIFD